MICEESDAIISQSPSFSSSIELAFRVIRIKKVHNNLFAIEAICIAGSRNRVKPNEACLIFVRNKNDCERLCQALDSATTLDSRWTTFQENQCIVILVDSFKTLERNRKGVKLVECQQIVRVVCGDNDEPLASVREPNNSNNPTRSEYDELSNNIHDKKERHIMFAKWLVETYGIDKLSTGSGVLDVAGGNGELSHAISKLGVPSILVDPNPRCGENVSFGVVAEALHDDGSHLFERNYEIGKLTSQCSLIAGMHPDQATEPIVDMALRLNVPFAVLPCCVMPSLFNHRKQQGSNNPVRSYSAFCQYLLDKAPEKEAFQVSHLPFVGRNKVIYRKIG